ncbi:MAG: DegV family protein [Lachnospiraceae bacterium]|nr:DegV family protein [Lachnospiraceae bacterium]
MGSIAIMTDSNSGITQDQGKAMGVPVVPMPFDINGKTYFEDIDLTQDQFYEMLGDGADISTSQPSPEMLMNMWREQLEKNDEVVYIPMSSGLSGSCATAIMLSDEDEFKGKVHVVDNQRISVTMRRSVLDAIEMRERGMTGTQIKDVLLRTKFDSSIYIMVDTLKYLKKGGRITKAAAAIGTILRIKPVLQIQGEKLDAFAKARTIKQAKSIMLEQVIKDSHERFGDDVHIAMAHTHNDAEIAIFKEEVQKAFPDHDIHVDPLSLSIACHIGPGSLAVTSTKVLRF